MDFGLATELYPEEYRYQPDLYASAQISPDMLQILQKLHTSLDPRTVFACYGKTIGQYLPVQGAHLQLNEQLLHWGRHHGISLKRIIGNDTSRLSIHYRLIQPLTQSQAKLLAEFESLLVQPLLNGVKFQAMSQQAMFDSLTQLGNRHYYELALNKAIAKSNRCPERDSSQLSLILLDLDNFKQLNDNFGHSFGDKVLKVFSSLLFDVIRDSDSAFRLGGDEFALIIHGDSLAASILCTRLQLAMKANELLRDYEISTSMGIANWEPSLKAEHLYDRADIALYQAKAAGRDCFDSFNNDTPVAPAQEGLRLANS